MYGNNPRSTAQIAGHPLHPMLIPLPIASFIGALATDVVGKVTGDPAWARASKWLLGTGLVTALGAAATGLTDYLGDERVAEIPAATYHMVANLSLVGIEAVNLTWRLVSDEDAPAGAIWLSAAAAGLVGYSGWLGGELSYRHRVGVQETVDEFSGYDDGHAEGGLGIPRGPALKEKMAGA
ncbi:DUF2231 domain-containing protein [Sphingomonas sp. BN140010]|uniref:DUF2231 domain-containing protein n=1 Tax=Sphingomonas arvum TaxID=2992113 RepID=A0ABT3JHG2_9SPHN|nr:DUF2231 domain-containing protein [Sphingomonas sp. BN140010]MCW3798512.1 DUF2231 domain-containing protein [Sphingomonas sp. BN140010]